MNLNVNPKQNFLDDQEKGTDLKIHLERTGVRSLILGCLCDGLVSAVFPSAHHSGDGGCSVIARSLRSAERLLPKTRCHIKFIFFQLCSIISPTKFKCQG